MENHQIKNENGVIALVILFALSIWAVHTASTPYRRDVPVVQDFTDNLGVVWAALVKFDQTNSIPPFIQWVIALVSTRGRLSALEDSVQCALYYFAKEMIRYEAYNVEGGCDEECLRYKAQADYFRKEFYLLHQAGTNLGFRIKSLDHYIDVGSLDIKKEKK